MSPTAAQIEAQTPADRDRWADALRVGSLLVVVLGHWLMVVVTNAGDITNVLTILPSVQPLTWVLQVMPLFFLVGGVAHAHTLLSGRRRARAAGGAGRPGEYAAFIRGRAVRLLRPTLAFLAVWWALGAIAHLTGLTVGSQSRLVVAALVMVPQLLWFVGIYLGIAAFAPPMFRLHERHGWWVVVALVVGAALVDLLRFRWGVPFVGNLNFALVWLALHQVGFAWQAGRLTTRIALILAVGGFAAMLACITWGPYPVSMVGLPGDEVSNMAPPSLALLAQGMAIIGAAALLRPVMARVLARPVVWRTVVTAGAFAMTAFLWHLTALLLVLLATRVAGLSLPTPATASWWWTRPLWFLALGVVTAALVAAFLRFDRGPRTGRDTPAGVSRWADPLAVLGVVVTVFGVLMVSIVGVDVLGNRPVFFLFGDVTPGVAALVLLVGLLVLWQAGRIRRPTPARP